jgi:hypothetical protein
MNVASILGSVIIAVSVISDVSLGQLTSRLDDIRVAIPIAIIVAIVQIERNAIISLSVAIII